MVFNHFIGLMQKSDTYSVILKRGKKHDKPKTDKKSIGTSEKVNERKTIFFHKEQWEV